ncbi:hypothetical protein SUGI_0911080 [Cryptomeria japonica]|nr:hypothetical protein SUGI_0911080 [Cryptomeria japonica]
MNRWFGFICMLLLLLRKSPVLAQLFVATALGYLLLQILGKRGRVFLRSGVGEETSLPRLFFKEEMVATIEEARFEMEECFIATTDELFKRMGVTPHAFVIVNHYKMKESVKTFSLSGMGCSAGC